MTTGDRLRRVLALGSLSFVTACGGTLDAGSDRTESALPVGPDNPVILTNDGPIDIATSGGSNRSPQLLVEDTPVVLLARGGTLGIGARPTRPDND